MAGNDRLGVMAKHWRPGQVKTRLAASVGEEAAASLYRIFLETTLTRFSRWPSERVIMFAPVESRLEFASVAGDRWRLRPQPRRGDLGDRMRAFFRDSLSAGRDRIVLIGADSPTLPVDYVRAAFRGLRECPLVLGPSHDGGYYLIGIRGRLPPVFHGLPWSTSAVWQATITALNHRSYPFAELPRWYDVDTFEDLRRLASELRGQGASKRTRKLRDAVLESVSLG